MNSAALAFVFVLAVGTFVAAAWLSYAYAKEPEENKSARAALRHATIALWCLFVLSLAAWVVAMRSANSRARDRQFLRL